MLHKTGERVCYTKREREFATNSEEIRAFLGINFIMSISKLPNVKCYSSAGNVMTKNRFMNVLQNLLFTDNQTAVKSDKAYKIHIVINHLISRCDV